MVCHAKHKGAEKFLGHSAQQQTFLTGFGSKTTGGDKLKRTVYVDSWGKFVNDIENLSKPISKKPPHLKINQFE